MLPTWRRPGSRSSSARATGGGSLRAAAAGRTLPARARRSRQQPRQPQEQQQQQRQPQEQQRQQRPQQPQEASVDSSADSTQLRKNPTLYSLLDGAGQRAVGSTGTFGGPPAAEQQQQQQQQQAASPAYTHPLARDAPGDAAAAGGAPAPRRRPLRKPEVLAPAGGWPQLRAAVENGADAVYFGVTGFNARARAANFEPDELPELMSYLRSRGVKGYCALNILVFDEELPQLEALVRELARAGVDAVIVQDLGAVALIRRVAPSLPIHGSTQMSITSAEGAEFAASLGVSRVVVGRELSVREIGLLAAGTSAEVEAFCHGALCVSYSGQCFSSEAWGGRSANRGQCAQACRMPYGLVVDGQLRDLHDIQYLLSPQDLSALDHLPGLIEAGVGCLKIEGRLKGPEYVAATTSAYRAGVDAAWQLLVQQQEQERQQDAGQARAGGPRGALVPPEVLTELCQVFSRSQDEQHAGLTPGFLDGSRHQRLVRGRSPRHRGLCLGRVAGFTDRGGVVVTDLLHPVKRGDGLVFDQGSAEELEQGGAVWDIFAAPKPSNSGGGGGGSSRRGRGGARRASAASSGVKLQGEAAVGSSVELAFAPGQVNASRLAVGDLIFKNRDPALEARLRSSYESLSSAAARKLPVQVLVSGSLGAPLRVELSDGTHTAAADSGDVLLAPAAKRALSAADVEAAIGQLGDNALAPSSIDLSGLALEQGLFLPASTLKAVRRAAAGQLLQELQLHGRADGLAEQPVLCGMLEAAAAVPSSHAQPARSQAGSSGRHKQQQQQPAAVPAVRVLCRSAAQVAAALDVPWLEEVVVDFLEVHGLKEAVASVQAAGKQAVVALPRIVKPEESRLLWFYLKLGADALLLRGAGCLQQLLELGGPGAHVPGVAALAARSGAGGAATPGGAVIPRLEGDFSFNAANVLGAHMLLDSSKSKISRLCPTHDLNAAQLAALMGGLGPRAAQVEVVVHQHLPVFHTEHCVFCRFLSSGSDFRDCGHPCETHQVHLRDSSGADHLVLADMGCRSSIYSHSAQSGVQHMARIAAAGCGMLRVELLDEPPELVAPLLQLYRDVAHGTRRPREAWSWLAANLPGGVSQGSLAIKDERAVSSLRPTARR